MKTKYYKNGSFIGIYLIMMSFIGIFCTLYQYTDYRYAETSFIKLLTPHLFLIGIFYLILIPGCWDLYVEEDVIIFRNDWNIFWLSEWRFSLKEITRIEVVRIHKEGPGIRIITEHRRELFYSLGYDRTKEFTKDIRQRGITVASCLE